MAIESLERALDLFGTPLYVYHEIVHNRPVVERFRKRGVVFVDGIDEIPEGGTVLYSAHGVAPAIRAASARRGLRAIDATCPLVTKVHLEAVRFAREGYTILLIGHEGHDEVLGTMAQACGKPAYLIDSVHELPADCFTGTETVLVTAGASAPEEVVEECIRHFRTRYGATVESRTVREEHVSFPLPRELRVVAG